MVAFNPCGSRGPNASIGGVFHACVETNLGVIVKHWGGGLKPSEIPDRKFSSVKDSIPYIQELIEGMSPELVQRYKDAQEMGRFLRQKLAGRAEVRYNWAHAEVVFMGFLMEYSWITNPMIKAQLIGKELGRIGEPGTKEKVLQDAREFCRRVTKGMSKGVRDRDNAEERKERETHRRLRTLKKDSPSATKHVVAFLNWEGRGYEPADLPVDVENMMNAVGQYACGPVRGGCHDVGFVLWAPARKDREFYVRRGSISEDMPEDREYFEEMTQVDEDECRGVVSPIDLVAKLQALS
jgi:hypothetical protein